MTIRYPNNEIEHRGECNVMHVARMLDTISAWELPIPASDKSHMVSLLRYVLQTEFTDINIYSFENKRIRLNEVVSTIVTARVSDNLKRLFRYGILAKTKDSEASMKFAPNLIISKIHSLGTIHTTDFTNDMDFYQSMKLTRKGPNSLGNTDAHKIGFSHKQLNPSQIGKIDLLNLLRMLDRHQCFHHMQISQTSESMTEINIRTLSMTYINSSRLNLMRLYRLNSIVHLSKNIMILLINSVMNQ